MWDSWRIKMVVASSLASNCKLLSTDNAYNLGLSSILKIIIQGHASDGLEMPPNLRALHYTKQPNFLFIIIIF